MTSSNSLKQSVTYNIEQIPDFLKTWSKRLKQTQLNTVTLLDEFALFWESAQPYLSPKNTSNMHNKKIMMKLGLEIGLFPEHIPRLTQTLLYFVNEDRLGNTVPVSQIQKVIKIMTEISNTGLFCVSYSSPNHIYDPKYFENAILENLTMIYGKRSGEWLQMPTPEYCRIGLTYYLQEIKRAEVFYPLSYENVRKVLINTIITENYEYLCSNRTSGILQQLSKKAISDLKAVYSLFKQSSFSQQEFYPPIKRICLLFNDFISEQIDCILAKPSEDSQSVITLTEEILEINSYVEAVFRDAFDNAREIYRECGHIQKRFPLIVADYANLFITKHLASDNSDPGLDAKIDAFFKVINKMYDKDIFLNKLRDLLALRLLEKASIDTEKKFLSKMSPNWGLGEQSKMKNMLDDITTSDELLKDWKSSSNNPKNIDFSIKVLRTSCWPDRLFVKDKQQKVFADPVLQDYKKRFTMYYQNKDKNKGKSLEWVINYGTAEIKTSGFQKSYFLQTTSIQMAVLLLFNYADTWTYGDIKYKLGLSEGSSHLWEALRYFTSRLKLINREQTGGGEGADKKPAEDNEKFSMNMAFKSDRIRINCVPILAIKLSSEKKSAEALALAEVMKEREFVIDAAIVRIMKSRREMALLDLQQETNKLINWFIPDPKMVKRRIDSLMERDYLERHPDKNNVFIYKP